VIPSTTGRDRGPGSRPHSTAPARRLPVPHLPERREGTAIYGLATLDHRGRIADLGTVRAMSWSSRTRLDIREQGGLLLVTASPQGVFSLTGQGHLRLPTTVRRWCGLAAGDRVLLMAEPCDGLLVVHPPAALDAMVAWLHSSTFGGRP
jgi:hypothetical protein